MGKIKGILKNCRGDAFVFILILVFFILTLSAILIEYFRMESLYQQVEYVLQRGVNSSVEYAMRDEYRRDGYALLDTEAAEEKLYEYLHESMGLDSEMNKYAGEEWNYRLEIQSIHATESPPRLTLDGELRTRSIFSFLTGEVRFPFSISSVNTRITEGGSE
ncbi:hypothetical protein SAMN02745975_01515 [Geosporobacter subterraneus DSM 17957]|jgi:hypothetical protein|uniref:Flp pilus-assembly TadE/G-like n=1 Tax=Geosporobacter subterraneus DSM 17957 TaxID=1121919 RepID=A0A1M6HDR2_9FIRM|nr:MULTISPECIES: hypothetical protein [Clostridia]SHJ20321.1 hypothetical protein SAMN02745975_01515 [Geosporobacter subterraneus DSM 17957]